MLLRWGRAATVCSATPLPKSAVHPNGVVAPPVAVVEIDGGRLQIFDRSKASDSAVSPEEYEPPELVLRSVVATKQDAYRFGELLAGAAWQRGFYGSSRRAFVGDGSSTIRSNRGAWLPERLRS